MHKLTVNHLLVYQQKNKEEPYEKLTEMSKNDGNSTGNLLYFYHKKYYKLIGILLVTYW